MKVMSDFFDTKLSLQQHLYKSKTINTWDRFLAANIYFFCYKIKGSLLVSYMQLLCVGAKFQCPVTTIIREGAAFWGGLDTWYNF